MAVNTPQGGAITRTFLAVADLSAKQGYLVSIVPGTENTVILATDNNDGAGGRQFLAGIVVDGGTGANTPVSVCIGGVCRANAGAVIAYGDFVTSAADGQATNGSADGTAVIGQALEDSVVNELFLVNVQTAALGRNMGAAA
jgi:hypothetical protein